MPYEVTTDPAAEPLTLTEAKSQLRVTASNEDTLITSLIVVARQYIEQITWRKLITQTLTLEREYFPPGAEALLLPGGDVSSITSISYTDTDGDPATVTTQQENLTAIPAELTPVYQGSWPSTRRQQAAVSIVYVAGYGVAGSDVPEPIRHAMRLLIGDYYEHRTNQPVVPIGSVALRTAVDNLLAPYKVRDDRLLVNV
jgi:uncharacterized phiE125 gp8 family phage protein